MKNPEPYLPSYTRDSEDFRRILIINLWTDCSLTPSHMLPANEAGPQLKLLLITDASHKRTTSSKSVSMCTLVSVRTLRVSLSSDALGVGWRNSLARPVSSQCVPEKLEGRVGGAIGSKKRRVVTEHLRVCETHARCELPLRWCNFSCDGGADWSQLATINEPASMSMLESCDLRLCEISHSLQ